MRDDIIYYLFDECFKSWIDCICFGLACGVGLNRRQQEEKEAGK